MSCLRSPAVDRRARDCGTARPGDLAVDRPRRHEHRQRPTHRAAVLPHRVSSATPSVAHEVVAIVRDVLGEALIGAYLHGSAVLGGLRPTSDVDVLAVIDRRTTEPERGALVDRLLEVSGRRARRGPGRPIELTILVQSDVRPWRHPPRVEFLYGEWRRNDYEAGRARARGDGRPRARDRADARRQRRARRAAAGGGTRSDSGGRPAAGHDGGSAEPHGRSRFGHAQRPAHARPDLGDPRHGRDQLQGPGGRMGARTDARARSGTAESRSRHVPRGLGPRRLGRCARDRPRDSDHLVAEIQGANGEG